jgi:hypothetical protein
MYPKLINHILTSTTQNISSMTHPSQLLGDGNRQHAILEATGAMGKVEDPCLSLNYQSPEEICLFCFVVVWCLSLEC